MVWLGSDNVGTLTDTHATIEELFSLSDPCGEDIRVSVDQLERVVKREREWSESSAVKEERFG
jgi:hypothetical protein